MNSACAHEAVGAAACVVTRRKLRIDSVRVLRAHLRRPQLRPPRRSAGAQRGQDRRVVAVAERVVEAGRGDVLGEAHPFELEERRRWVGAQHRDRERAFRRRAPRVAVDIDGEQLLALRERRAERRRRAVAEPVRRELEPGEPGALRPERRRQRDAARVADAVAAQPEPCLLYTSPSPRDQRGSRMPSSA